METTIREIRVPAMSDNLKYPPELVRRQHTLVCNGRHHQRDYYTTMDGLVVWIEVQRCYMDCDKLVR